MWRTGVFYTIRVRETEPVSYTHLDVYKRQVQDQVWLCVCGRANPIESQRCCRCERRRDAVFASFSQENVRQVIAVHEQKLAETARRAREDNSMLVEAQEKQRIAKRRRRRQAVKLGLSAACILAVAAVVIIWGIPTMRYNAALRLLRDGQYNDCLLYTSRCV